MPYQNEEQLKKSVKQRIQMINEDLKNNLNSLSLEDNFDQQEVEQYHENERMAIEYQQTLDGITLRLSEFLEGTYSSLDVMDGQILLKVRKADAISQLNIEETGIVLESGRFIVDTQNFKVNANGVYVNGRVTANTGKIGKWSFSGGTASGDSQTLMSGGTIEARNASCKYVSARKYYLNPNAQDNYHEVDMSHSEWQVGETNSKSTTFDSTMTSYGSININKDIEACSDIHCTRLRLTRDGSYTNKCIIYCSEIVTDTKTFSDERLKKNIVPVTEEEAGVINRISPVSFTYIENDIRSTGMIAQDLEPILKEKNIDTVITEMKGYMGIEYKELIPLMVRQIQANLDRLERIGNAGD